MNVQLTKHIIHSAENEELNDANNIEHNLSCYVFIRINTLWTHHESIHWSINVIVRCEKYDKMMS